MHTRDGQQLHAGHLITTIPLPLLARIVTPAAPPPAVHATAWSAARRRFADHVVED